MAFHFTAFLVFAGVLGACGLWGAAELRNWSLWSRLLFGVCTIVLFAALSVAVSQMQAATREHYYRTVLTVLSRKSAQGQEELVRRSLAVYAHSAEDPDDMKAVVDLYRTLMKTDR